MNKFKIGKIYSTRSLCDHECIFSYKVIGRSEKTVILKDDSKTVKRRKIHIDNAQEGEYCFPDGLYSMCPMIRASKTIY